MDRRNFLELPVLGGGAVFASALPGCASDETRRREPVMTSGALSRTRLGSMHDVMAGYVERGEVPGIVTLVSRRGEAFRLGYGFGLELPFDSPMQKALNEKKAAVGPQPPEAKSPEEWIGRFATLLFEKGNEAFVRHECELKTGERFRNTEFFRIEEDRVKEVEVYFGSTTTS